MTDPDNSDAPKIVKLPAPKMGGTVLQRNDLMKTAQAVARCCGMKDLEYERSRVQTAKELGVRPKFLDDMRKQSWETQIGWCDWAWKPFGATLAGTGFLVEGTPAYLVRAYVDKEGTVHSVVIYPDDALTFGFAISRKLPPK